MESKRRRLMIRACCPLLLAAACLLAGCEQPAGEQDLLETKIFTATLPGGAATRTLLSDAADDPRSVLWQEGDVVRIVGATQADYRAGSLSPDRTSATLEPVTSGSAVSAPNASGRYEAFYPASLYAGGKFVLPPVQSYTPVASTDGNRVVASHLPMYARSTETSLTFRNLCAVLNFKLTGTDADRVTRIEVTNDESFLCGEFEVAETSSGSGDWHAVMKSSGTGLSKTVALDCTGGMSGGYVQLSATPTEFCVAVPADTYAKDKLTVEVYGPSSSNPILSFANETADAVTGSVVEYSKIYEIPRTVKPKYLPGLFSVSETEKVYFSRGNLQVNYTGTGTGYTREWLFSENQWDVFYTTVDELISLPNPPEGTTVKLSHFSWATAGHERTDSGGNGLGYGYDDTHTSYDPHMMPINNSTYGPSFSNWNGHNGQVGPGVNGNNWNAEIVGGLSPANEFRSYCDWGIHFDADGVGYDKKYDGTTWFTLSDAQWKYLFRQRPSYAQKRGFVRIDIDPDPAQETFVSGAVILPDVWQCPDGCSFAPGSTYSQYIANTYDAATTWPLMEASGAVFLPAAGYRQWATGAASTSWPYQNDPQNIMGPGVGNLHCRYWSSSGHYGIDGYSNEILEAFAALIISPTGTIDVYPSSFNGNNIPRGYGYSVRLVRYAPTTP